MSNLLSRKFIFSIVAIIMGFVFVLMDKISVEAFLILLVL